jgi:ABC-type bacteriocin/lantibiotic exporter with double-glycine peptidase domain
MPDLFMGQEDGKNCGPCVIAMILAYFKRLIRFYFADERGTSSRKILNALRKKGLEVKSKDINIRNLKPWSILWYPPRGEKRKRGDHYVVFVKSRKSKYFIYDPVKEGPEWLTESELKKVWYRKDRKRPCGWVIEIRDPRSRA